MFAALSVERDPLSLGDLPAGLIIWIQDAGAFAAFGLLLFLVLGLPRWTKRDFDAVPGWKKTFSVIATVLSFAFLLIGGLLSLIPPSVPILVKAGDIPPRLVTGWANHFLTVGGLLSLVVVGLPLLENDSHTFPADLRHCDTEFQRSSKASSVICILGFVDCIPIWFMVHLIKTSRPSEDLRLGSILCDQRAVVPDRS
jgi:hypothetical protein